ncbi:MAG: hypothetical protein SCK70_01350 [bacterium]|nr:hypothetical protein [bacterium]
MADSDATSLPKSKFELLDQLGTIIRVRRCYNYHRQLAYYNRDLMWTV